MYNYVYIYIYIIHIYIIHIHTIYIYTHTYVQCNCLDKWLSYLFSWSVIYAGSSTLWTHEWFLPVKTAVWGFLFDLFWCFMVGRKRQGFFVALVCKISSKDVFLLITVLVSICVALASLSWAPKISWRIITQILTSSGPVTLGSQQTWSVITWCRHQRWIPSSKHGDGLQPVSSSIPSP